ncbi:LamG-like jellyroll fold domain-containing protein [Demequina sp. NBRC 110051]|uniref:LamG-like jellyroll fold domain-containing protein n=1 Tax=Demequina sp. NBRC 110051 TaxID=1570340 RepID=UPI000A030113|nr:LamG-like jellyroll fold domain-containing protein [Demequina sp. NBRC 110051]
MRDAMTHRPASRRAIASVAAVGITAAGITLTAPIPATAVEIPEPIVEYTMDGIDGTTVPDSHDTALDGVIAGTGAEALAGGYLRLPGGAAGSGAGVVEIPNSVLDGAGSVTVTSRILWEAGTDWDPVFSLGGNDQAWMILNARTGADFGAFMRAGIGLTGPGTEAQTTGSEAVPVDTWVTVATVLDTAAGTVTTYLDGEAVGSVVTDVTAADLFDADGVGGRIGGSPLGFDRFFGGVIDDFQVYDTALTAEQIATITPAALPAAELHYTMDDVDGTTVADASGNGHDGALLGSGATARDGVGDGAALDLSGAGDSVTFPASAVAGTTNVTVSARVRWDGTHDWGWLYGLGATGDAFAAVIPSTGPEVSPQGVLRTDVGLGSDVTAAGYAYADAPLATEEWSTVTLTLDDDADELRTYIDGTLATTFETTVTVADLVDADDPIGGRLGGSAFAWDPTFDGLIDDFQIFRSALSADQVKTLAWTGDLADPSDGGDGDIPEPVPGEPFVHYTMDGIDGANIIDATGNGLDGTLVGTGYASVDGEATASALELSGAHVTIPGAALTGADSITASATIKWAGGGAWQRVFDLGSSTNRYLFLTPSNGGDIRTAITTAGGGGEDQVTGYGPLKTGEWVNLTVTLDTEADLLTVYVNGVALSATPSTIAAGDLLGSSASMAGYLGKSFYPDPAFDGAFEDFVLYREALTATEVADLVDEVPVAMGLVEDAIQVYTKVGEAPELPAAVRATYSDGYDRDVAVEWEDVDPADYAQSGEFTVTGIAAGETVTATVLVNRGEVRVDLGTDTGEFMGGASGLLYGLYGDGMPTKNLIEGMNIRTVATKAQDGAQHPGSDALEILPMLADSTDGDVYLRVTDWYRGFPYQWPDSESPNATKEERLASYREVLNTQLDMIEDVPEEYRDNLVIEPYNEPGGNMFGTGTWSLTGTSWLSDPTDYFAAWDETYRTIKARFPDMRVAGPGAIELWPQIEGWLAHTVQEGTVPDIVTWHELTHPQAIRESVEEFRGWEADVFAGTAWEGTELPLNINEYAFNYHTSVPGQMIQWISAIEDSKVDAMIAFWNINGNLSDSAVQSNRGNGQWWLYHAYSQMTGHTVQVTPPNPGENYTLQGVATLDEDIQQARAIIGGGEGAAPVDFVDVPESFGDSVRVWVKEIDWTGQLGDSAQPAVLAERVLPVTDATATVEFGSEWLPELTESSAYEIIVTPAGNATDGAPSAAWEASYEAEDASYTGEPRFLNGPEGSPSDVAKFYTSGGYNIGGLRTDSDLELTFDVAVPEDGEYDLSVFSSTLNSFASVADQGPTNIFVRVDGGDEQEIHLPLAYKWVVWDHADTTVNLSAGEHTITLAAQSLDGARHTQGDALIDRIVLATTAAADAVDTYEGELAESSASRAYGAAGSGSGVVTLTDGGQATFWVYGDHDGEHQLEVAADAGASGAVAINGYDVLDLSRATQAAVHLAGGINKVVVTGPAVVDSLTIGASQGLLDTVEYQAEDATVTGSATVVDLSLAEGGQAVSGIGGDPGNANTLTFDVQADKAGQHAVVVRFSNPEQAPASHYNPNPMVRYARISVNGADEERYAFVPTFHENNFWERTLVLDLDKGVNTIALRGEELPNYDGESYISDTWPDYGWLRADSAPIVDRITVSPLAAVTSAAGPGYGAGNGQGNAYGFGNGNGPGTGNGQSNGHDKGNGPRPMP